MNTLFEGTFHEKEAFYLLMSFMFLSNRFFFQNSKQYIRQLHPNVSNMSQHNYFWPAIIDFHIGQASGFCPTKRVSGVFYKFCEIFKKTFSQRSFFWRVGGGGGVVGHFMQYPFLIVISCKVLPLRNSFRFA